MLRLGLAFGACAVTGALAWACSQGSQQPPFIPDTEGGTNEGGNGGDASTTDAAKACFEDDGGCSTLQSCGGKVYVIRVAADAPDASGGTVPDGTYVLTTHYAYTGQGGASGQVGAWFIQTMSLLSAGTDDAGAQLMAWDEVGETSAVPTPASASGSAHFAAPTSVHFDVPCPSNGSPFVGDYSVVDGGLKLYVPSTDGLDEIIYVKQ